MKSVTTCVLTLAMLLAFAQAADEEQSIFRGSSPKGDAGDNGANSWATMSADNNPWSGQATAGAVIGFTVFGLSYIYVVIRIFMDIANSKSELTNDIENDLAIIKQLNIPPNMAAEWEQ